MLKVMWAPLGKLAPQLLGVITFAYDFCFRCMIDHWKGISKKWTLCRQNITLFTV
jgi:hypothetical protein